MNSQIRRQFIQRRQQFAQDAARLKAASAVICANIMQSAQYQNAHSVGVYLARDEEVNLQILIEHARQAQKHLLAPRVVGAAKPLEFAPFDNDLVVNHMNIAEPSQAAYRQPMDLLIVPLVVFDNACRRIGMGGGFYDRSLTQNCAKTTFGVGFSWQQHEQINAQSWDVPLDFIYSETDTFCRPSCV